MKSSSWKVISDFVVPSLAVCIDMFLIFSFLGTFSETRVGDSDRVTTNAVDIAQREPTQHKLEASLTIMRGLTTGVVSNGGESSQPEGLQVSWETAATVVEETYSNIADMIEELFQAGGSEILMIEAGVISTSAEDVAEGPFQSVDSYERVISRSSTKKDTSKVLFATLVLQVFANTVAVVIGDPAGLNNHFD